PKESGAAIELHSFVRQLNAALNVEQYLRTLDEVKSFLLDLINHDFEMEGKYSRLIVHLLHQLFERLSLPREMQQDVDKLRTLIEQGYNPKSWSKVLDTIDVVTTDFRKKLYTEREDIEHFLIEITNRLKELELFVKKSAEYSEHALEKGKEFNDSMVFELNGIGRSLANTMDLDNLKDEISSRLEAIEFRLNLFWEEDNVRHETTREQVRSLIGLLNNMDAEASQLRLRMKRQRMEAMIDPLTAVANRLSYNDKIRDEIARAKRYGEPLCLVVWDIDYFKKINDRYGHVAGDNALKSVAKLLSQRIRETDYIARYGGEEFVLLLPSTRIPNAVESCNQIRELVEEAKFHFQGERIAITLSAGIAEFSAGDTPESLFNRADEALYRAKEEGRNRVVTAI
ncbi:MAG: GGDEF domain-containing protein, partial [Gammaproteobacteria bacterium]|nr:GGDEF domain-containing protein [Gammaproteobacteria bacterium]